MGASLSYSLPPDKLAQAVAFAHTRYALHFSAFAISALVLLLLVRIRFVPRIRRWNPALIVAAVVLVTTVCDLPAVLFGHAASLRFGISIQPWPSWFWDWTKEQMLTVVISVAILIPFYALLRRSPRRWWLYAWLASVPLTVASAYLEPLVIEPLFNKYEPLSSSHPELIPPIRSMLARARVSIPDDHLYLMRASEKTTALNAYFSGFGASQRLVLYDTIVAKENGGPLLTTIGHELGHFVLHHIQKGLAFSSAAALIGLWVIAMGMRFIVHRWGPRLDVPAVADWSSLPLFLLLALLLGFLSEPLDNAFSRRQEKQADLYALEITRGLIPHPGLAAARAFQTEGETDLEEPHPNPWIVFWLYSHPPVAERLRYSLNFSAPAIRR